MHHSYTEDAGRLSQRELYGYRHFGKEISAVKVPPLGRSGNLNLTKLKYSYLDLDLLLHKVMEWHRDHKNKDITITLLRLFIVQGYREDTFNEKQ